MRKIQRKQVLSKYLNTTNFYKFKIPGASKNLNFASEVIVEASEEINKTSLNSEEIKQASPNLNLSKLTSFIEPTGSQQILSVLEANLVSLWL